MIKIYFVMELKDIKSIRRRAKRLRNVYLALGIIISFISDLRSIRFKSPFSIFLYDALSSSLVELRYRVVKEQELINGILENVQKFGSSTSKDLLNKYE